MQLFRDIYMKIVDFLDFRDKLKVTELNKESSTIHIIEMNLDKEYNIYYDKNKCFWNLSITDKILSQNKYTLLESLELKGDNHRIQSFKYLTKLKTLRIGKLLEYSNDLPINLTTLVFSKPYKTNINLNYLQNLTYLNIKNTIISLKLISCRSRATVARIYYTIKKSKKIIYNI